MTNMIQVFSNFHRARVFIINTRPDEIADYSKSAIWGRGAQPPNVGWGRGWSHQIDEIKYRGASLIRTPPPPYDPYDHSSPMPRDLW